LGFTQDELGHCDRRAAIKLFEHLQIDGEVLAFARQALGLSQVELAQKLGVTAGTVCQWENGAEFSQHMQLEVLSLLRAAEKASWVP
jgi:DNA-binding transcriptional regulator YiaG